MSLNVIAVSIGLVITFVGLGEKGFKTIELKMIGPTLCVSGLLCIFYKILQCIFPRLFRKPKFFKRPKLGDSKSNVSGMEKGIQNGHLGINNAPKPSSEVFSPRVTLTHQSSIKVSRPQSTVPNFIEDTSEEDDDFDPGRPRPYFNRSSSTFLQELHIQHQLEQKQLHHLHQLPQQLQQSQVQKDEVLLNPKTLKL